MEDEKKYELFIPRAVATGIILEAAEKFGLEVDQEKKGREDVFEMEQLPRSDYVPRIVLRSDSQEKLELARIYIYKRHEEWVENLEKEREKRSERIMKKMRR